jgi:hypothetical protein
MKKIKVLPWGFGSALLVVLVFAGALVAGLGSCEVAASLEPSATSTADGDTRWIRLIPDVPVDGSDGIRTTKLTLIFSKSVAAFTDYLNLNTGRDALAKLFTFSYQNGELPYATAFTKDGEGVYILTVSNVPKDDSGGDVTVTIKTSGITPPTQVWRLDAQPAAPVLGHIALLIEFRFKAVDNPALSADVVGRIDQQLKTVAVVVPAETPLGDLTPDITLYQGGSSEGGTDFTASPVTFTITAEDGITQSEYLVTVTAEDASSTPPETDTVHMITDLELGLFITAPETGEAPVPALQGPGQISSVPFETEQYTGVVVWTNNDTSYGVFYEDKFDWGFYYTATVVLAAKTGYTFTGVTANSCTYNAYDHTQPNNGQITNPAGSGSTLIITIAFPLTEDTAEVGGPI